MMGATKSCIFLGIKKRATEATLFMIFSANQKDMPTKPTIATIIAIAITKVLSCLQTRSDPELIANLLASYEKNIIIVEGFPQVSVYPYPTDSVNYKPFRAERF